MYGLRAGWRWVGDGLQFCKEWELEDKDKSDVERTKVAMGESMQWFINCLFFTVETGEDFDGCLPTLDLNIKVSEKNVIN